MNLTAIPRVLETTDLRLRPLGIQDDAGLFAMLSDTESMKYWCSPPLTRIEQARHVLEEDVASDAAGKSLCWAVTLRPDLQMIGKCILFQISQQNRRAEIGYILNRQYWGLGLMSQALGAVIDFAFNELGLHRIEADVDPHNAGSLALLEKLGFQREGLFRDRWLVYGKWHDSVMLGLVREE